MYLGEFDSPLTRSTKNKPKMKQTTKDIFLGRYHAVWLNPLTNLEAPFGAGACTLD
jgi:hypothetical protein